MEVPSQRLTPQSFHASLPKCCGSYVMHICPDSPAFVFHLSSPTREQQTLVHLSDLRIHTHSVYGACERPPQAVALSGLGRDTVVAGTQHGLEGKCELGLHKGLSLALQIPHPVWRSTNKRVRAEVSKA